MKKIKTKKKKFKLEISHLHLIADTLILVLGIFLGAFLYAQLAPKTAVNQPAISVQGIEAPIDEPQPMQGTTCGNLICETGESYINCRLDCPCDKNGICESQYGENSTICPEDCPKAPPPIMPGSACIQDSNCGAGEICLNPNTTMAQCIQKLNLQVSLYSPRQNKDHNNNLITTTIKGQQQFQFVITPVDSVDSDILKNYIDDNQTKVVLVNSTGVVVKEMYCVKDTNQTPYEEGVKKVVDQAIPMRMWVTTYCDTLAFANSQEDLKIRLLPKSTSRTTLPLIRADVIKLFAEQAGEFVNFLKFRINNTGIFAFSQPAVGATVFGTVPMSATVSNAKVSGVTFKINSQSLAATDSGTGVWQINWVTSRGSPVNGNYYISIYYNPIDPNVSEMNPSLSRTVSLQNTDTNCGVITCSAWTCTSDNLQQTKTCTDKCNYSKTETLTPPNITNKCTYADCVACTTQVEQCKLHTDWKGYQSKKCEDECGIIRTTDYIKCDPYTNCELTQNSVCGAWSECVNSEKSQICKDSCGNDVKVTAQCEIKSSVTEPTTKAAAVTPSITYPTANLEISDPQPEIKGTAQGGSSVRVHWVDSLGNDAQSADPVLVPSTNVFTYAIPKPLSEGTYKVYAEVFSADGKTIIKSDSVSFKILSPEVVMLIPQAGQQLTASVTLTAELKRSRIYSLEFYRNKVGGLSNILIGKATVQASSPNVWQYFWDTSDTANGEYDIYAKVKDAAKVKIYSSNKVRVTINHDITTLVPEEPKPVEPQPTDDTDGDGIPDIIEKKLGSDPNNPDSDGDGIPDGVAVEKGKSPIGGVAIKPEVIKEAQEQIAGFRANEPKYAGVVNKDLQVSSISSVAVEIGRDGILIEGKGPANTILTIYIYSRPIVVTTKTDENGNFSYVLEKDIAEGEHEVYVTVTDETGKVKEKGEPMTFFVKKARAVTRDEYFRGDVDVEQKAPPVLKTYIILCLAIILAVLIGFIIYRLVKGPEKPSQRIRLKEDTGIKSK